MKIYDVNFEFRNPFKIERKKTSNLIKRSLKIAHNFGMKKAFQKSFLKKLMERKQKSLKDYINTQIAKINREKDD